MARLGLLVLARGRWKGEQVIPSSFIKAMETRQSGDANPRHHPRKFKRPEAFPKAPYGYRVWVNSERLVFKDAAADWAWANREDYMIFWNHRLGLVFATFNMADEETRQRISWRHGPYAGGILKALEDTVAGPNPLTWASAANN